MHIISDAGNDYVITVFSALQGAADDKVHCHWLVYFRTVSACTPHSTTRQMKQSDNSGSQTLFTVFTLGPNFV